MASTKIPLELTAYAPDADGATLELQTTDTTVTDGSVLGKIEFKAPKEASGTDAILVGAAIEAVAEGTFAADNNATELVFKTGASEAAAQKMVLTSAGNLGVGVTPTAKLSLPAQASGDSGIARFAIESGVDSNDFTISQYEDGTGTYTLMGQNISLNSGGNVTVLDSAHKTAGVLFDGRGNGQLQFYTGAANASSSKMTVDSSGNVGIGTTSIDGTLHLDGGTNSELVIEKDGAGYGKIGFHSDGSQTAYISSGGDEHMYYYGASGVMQIFYAGGSETLALQAGQADVKNADLKLEDSRSLYLGAGNDLRLYHDGSTSYITDTSSAALVINGGNSGGVKLQAGSNSSHNSLNVTDKDGNSLFVVRGDGTYTHAGSETSDRDLKENILEVSGTSLDKICKLPIKSFKMKPTGDDLS